MFGFTNEVNAKSQTQNNITINFDDDNILNMAYRNINSFKILEDKSFYFNGVKHTFNNNYTLVDNEIMVDNNSFVLEGDTLIIDLENNKVKSSKVYETYGFRVSASLRNTKEYTFTQQLCYKYNEIEACNSDKDDQAMVKEDNENYAFYSENIPVTDFLYKECDYKLDNTLPEIDDSFTLFTPLGIKIVFRLYNTFISKFSG